MKKISVVVMGIILALSSNLFAQNERSKRISEISPIELAITYSKTSNIVFPYAIVGVDRGSSDVLAQKAKGVENILQLKAAIPNFKETNLTVITADGHLYSYVLSYLDSPRVLNIQYERETKDRPALLTSSPDLNDADVKSDSKYVSEKERPIRRLKKDKYDVRFSIDGIYIHSNVMYYQVVIKNSSHVDYDIDQLRFYIRDKKKAKRTATQEIEVKPTYVENDAARVLAATERRLVFAMPKFTLPDDKDLIVQLMEKDGGRHLELKVSNDRLINAIPVTR
ncbi:conjugative transposon protein TraN [Mucilaginibacter paludis]|uniref:Conjugative transposon TraN protein n=1 Tax=Mucilaginibacter paludis DSM 18603 TaxID=714943 RepID=H1YAG3_9SPHI|nr:conjugative transposon protein TraN [Mucilaginibacter paludis]EHQ27006.1 conjugative transposon TraN protein [Mucilaginibacter paludis DSM 18603]